MILRTSIRRLFGRLLTASLTCLLAISLPASAEDPPVSRYNLEDPLFDLLESMQVAAHEEDISAFEGHVSPAFIMTRDFGGMTSEEGLGMPNFLSALSLKTTSKSEGSDGGFGWRHLEFLLGATHLEKTEDGYCGPYFSPEISIVERNQLCYEKIEGTWMISYLIGAGD